MKVKLLEILDRSTCIPAMAVLMYSEADVEKNIIARAGYTDNPELIMLCHASGGRIEYDYYNWGDRTYRVAHHYITENWDSIESGDVIDVEYILGESSEKKQSEIQR